MQVQLNDSEIREALAEIIKNKLVVSKAHKINPENCWFEVESGDINEDEGTVEDIHNVRFIYDTTQT